MGRIFNNCRVTRFANTGEGVTVRVPGFREVVRAIAGTVINSPNVFLIVGDDGRAIAYCNSAPQPGRRTTGEFLKVRPVEEGGTILRYGFSWIVSTTTREFSGETLAAQYDSLKFYYKQDNEPSILFLNLSWARENPLTIAFEYSPLFWSSTCHLIDKNTTFVEALIAERKSKPVDEEFGEDFQDLRITHRRFLIRNKVVTELQAFLSVDESLETPANLRAIPNREDDFGVYLYGNSYTFGANLPAPPYVVPTKYHQEVSRNQTIPDIDSPLGYRFIADPPFVAPATGFYWREPDFQWESVIDSKIYAPICLTEEGSRLSFGIGSLLRTGTGVYDFELLQGIGHLSGAMAIPYTTTTFKSIVFEKCKIEIYQTSNQVEAALFNAPGLWTETGIGRRIDSVDFDPEINDPDTGEKILDPGFTAPSDLSESDILRLSEFRFPNFKVAIFQA